MSEIKDIGLYESGERKIQWVKANMPLLRALEEEFSADKPFKGLKVALSVHLEAKTAYLCRVLAAGGANMYITGSNPLSTQDDVAAALVKADSMICKARRIGGRIPRAHRKSPRMRPQRDNR